VDQRPESVQIALQGFNVPIYQLLYPDQVNAPADVWVSLTTPSQMGFPADWYDPEYRHGYVEAVVAEDIALQIRLNRERRGWSQKELADRLGTKQSAISRLESPAYGAQSIETLLKVAQAFDCGLELRLVPFSYLADRRHGLNRQYFYVGSFENEAVR
jgi:DNA-binding XRE family transcriptional regulator